MQVTYRNRRFSYAAICACVVALVVLIERGMGRTAFCRCGVIRLWTADAWGPENSQQFTDPYTFTHITHGILLYALLSLLAGRLSVSRRGLLALVVESGWELLENTDWVIGRYRAATVALGYYGDTVFNSVGDIAACMVGFVLSAYLPVRATIVLVIVLELGLAVWIRDGLLLNILLLVHPIEAVRSWQLAH
ncbi:MAG TPA: hypothetical protein DEP35_00160 [Deltaproteobacteria bacterium]|jgi:hypothetical protein|nr:hypothetical protein [Deltaproteobacteria bacterium]